jgi:nucleotide-binding universal stress UspA family protein
LEVGELNAISNRYETIVVATDFSDAAEVAARGAAALAKAWGSRVELVHALLPNRYAAEMLPGSESEVTERLDEAAQAALTRTAERNFADVEVKTILLHGTRPADAVAKHAETIGASLCVVGTQGRTGLARMLIGSVAETVVRLAPCDVLCIPPRSDLAGLPPRRILAPTDLSENAQRGLEVAADIARQASSHLSLLHVIDASRPAVPAAAFYENSTAKQKHLGELAQYRSEALSDVADVTTEVFSDPSPPDAIARFAASDKADLIVLSTHGRTGLSRLLIGSVAERVARHAPCPTLVVRAQKT